MVAGGPGRARFHRTYIIRVSRDGRGFVGVGSGGPGDELEIIAADGEDGYDVLDKGLDFIRTKTGRRTVAVFITREDAESGDRWYAAVTSPTL